MSIIHEALKKAVNEKEAVPSSTYQETVRKKLELELHKKSPAFSWGGIFILLLVLLVAGPIVAPLFSTPSKKGTLPSKLSSSANLPGSNETRHAQFGIEELPLFGKAPAPKALTPGFHLTGVVYSPTDSYCILNDQIVKVGEEVQGARLTKITATGVTLEYQGKEIVLAAS